MWTHHLHSCRGCRIASRPPSAPMLALLVRQRRRGRPGSRHSRPRAAGPQEAHDDPRAGRGPVAVTRFDWSFMRGYLYYHHRAVAMLVAERLKYAPGKPCVIFVN